MTHNAQHRTTTDTKWKKQPSEKTQQQITVAEKDRSRINSRDYSQWVVAGEALLPPSCQKIFFLSENVLQQLQNWG